MEFFLIQCSHKVTANCSEKKQSVFPVIRNQWVLGTSCRINLKVQNGLILLLVQHWKLWLSQPAHSPDNFNHKKNNFLKLIYLLKKSGML